MGENKSAGVVFDREQALRRVEGDLELLRELWEIFEEDSIRMISQIRQGVDSGDSDKVHRNTHTLRGSVANFVANETVAACLELERLSKNQTVAELPGSFERLESALNRLRDEIKNHVL